MDFLRAYCYSCDNQVHLEDLDFCVACEEFIQYPEFDSCRGTEIFGCEPREISHEFSAAINLTCNICHRGIDNDEYLHDIKHCDVCDTQVHLGEENECWDKHLEVCNHIAKINKFRESL